MDAEQWMVLTVKRDKKEKNRLLLYGQSEDEHLSVHEDLLVRYRLMKGSVITKELEEQIRKDDDRYRAYSLAVAYLGRKPRTSKEIYRYLSKKELDDEHIQSALDRLESEQFVDDRQYARQFATSRLNSAMKGRHMIRQELQQRGVSGDAASEALAELDGETELGVAKSLAHKKSRTLKGETVDKKRKLVAFLMRRGFPSDVTRAAVQSVEWADSMGPEDDEDGIWLDN